MSKVFVAILAICLTQASYGHVVRETSSPAPNLLIDAFQQVFGLFTNASEEIHKAFLKTQGVNSDIELWNKTRDDFVRLENTVRSGIGSLTEEAKQVQGKAQEVFNDFLDKANKVVKELQSKTPEFFSGDFKKVQELGNQTFRTIAEEVQKLQANLLASGQQITPKIEAIIKSIYNAAIKPITDNFPAIGNGTAKSGDEAKSAKNGIAAR